MYIFEIHADLKNVKPVKELMNKINETIKEFTGDTITTSVVYKIGEVKMKTDSPLKDFELEMAKDKIKKMFEKELDTYIKIKLKSVNN